MLHHFEIEIFKWKFILQNCTGQRPCLDDNVIILKQKTLPILPLLKYCIRWVYPCLMEKIMISLLGKIISNELFLSQNHWPMIRLAEVQNNTHSIPKSTDNFDRQSNLVTWNIILVHAINYVQILFHSIFHPYFTPKITLNIFVIIIPRWNMIIYYLSKGPTLNWFHILLKIYTLSRRD